jgi:hypothetical protein
MANFFLNVSTWFSSWTIADVQALTNIIQNLTLTAATFVAAWWAYATFGLKEKTDELLAIARKIGEIHSHIDGSASTYNSYEILVGLASFDTQKLTEVKQAAEVRLAVLREELNELQELSLRIPIIFRVLTIGEYQSVLIDMSLLGGIEHWGEEEVKEKLQQAKFKILNDIYTEINRHGNFLRKIQVAASNTMYRVKDIRVSIK